MKASVSYQEISQLVSSKVGQQITFEPTGEASRVKSSIHGLPLYVKIESISGDEVNLSHQVGDDVQESQSVFDIFKIGAQKLAKEAVNQLVDNLVKGPGVSVNEDKTICVKLSEIEQLKGMLKAAELKDVYFDEAGANVEVTLV